MDFTQIIIAVISLVSAVGLSSFFTIKFTKQKAQADAMASVQDVYQETITDLRQDKTLLKEERDQARNDFKLIAEKVEQNSRDIEAIKRENADIKAENAIIKAENEALKGSLCKNMDCKNRKTK